MRVADQDWESAITAVLEDEDFRGRLTLAAEEAALEKFQLEPNAEAWDNAFESVLGIPEA